jgi:hypothetical protein
MSRHHSSLGATERRKDRERQQLHRNKLKAAARPTTHIINRAVAEAFFCMLDVERKKGIPSEIVMVSVLDIVSYVAQVLSAGTNASDRYDKSEVLDVVRKRITGKSLKKFRLDVTRPTQRRDDITAQD